eukprot:TRINITY_DN29134_c0_g1_i2.p1 TRINITY_DN29134_c0_g1~~TRINITY_DN29134_c0_g1_i2.p1  ORF type:complete len:775 (+),score=191.37 TRINITY_DN29134_c0_g1_i2:84-2408(+)
MAQPIQLGPTPPPAPPRSSTGSFTQWTRAIEESVRAMPAVQALQETATRACASCEQRIVRYSGHTCKECSRYFCGNCMVSVHLFNPAGISSQATQGWKVKACRFCGPSILAAKRKENVEERMKRVNAYMESRLEPYKYSPESKVEQSFRLGGHVIWGVKKVAAFLPIAGEIVMAVNASYYLVRYGPLVLAGEEVVLALQLLVGLATKLEVPALSYTSPQDFFGGLYYMMGEYKGERGKAPELERLEHIDSVTGEVPAPTQESLQQLRFMSRICAVACQAPTPTDAQRLLKHALPGSDVVLAELSNTNTVPSYYVTCVRAQKQCYLLLPGTSSIADICTDVNAESERLGDRGRGHKGMIESARWLHGEVAPVLIYFYTQGYQVSIVGHSLGAGVGAQLTVMLRPQIGSLFCYGFGTPACVDEELMIPLLDCMISVVNRDDVVPRLSVHNVQHLAHETLCEGQKAKTKSWMYEDWKAVQDVQRIIELRRRETPVAALPGPNGGEAGDGALGEEASKEEKEKLRLLMEAGVQEHVAERALRAESGDLTKALLRATSEEHDHQWQDNSNCNNVAAGSEGALAAPPKPPPPPDAASGAGAGSFAAAFEEGSQSVFRSLRRLGVTPSAAQALQGSAERDRQVRFYVPGQIIHLYAHNGLRRAALTQGTHDSLMRIVPTPAMLDDHMVASYEESLRQACLHTMNTPRWESFEERTLCSCCGADFNWAYVLRSEPQRMLARHNCYCCGKVVCEGCSPTRQAHQHLGLLLPVRTCDACKFQPH